MIAYVSGTSSGVTEVCGALSEVGGLGPLPSNFFSIHGGP